MKRTPTVEFYEAADGWRWRLRARNGRIVAQGESHGSKRDAVRAFETMRGAAYYAEPKR